MNCTDLCTVEIAEYGNGYIGPTWSAGLYDHAVLHGKIFAPACSAVSPEICREIKQSVSQDFWGTKTTLLLKKNTSLFRRYVESHNQMCQDNPQSQRLKVQSNLDFMDNPTIESHFSSYQPSTSHVNRVWIGDLIHSGKIMGFYKHRLSNYGISSSWKYSKQLKAHLSPSLDLAQRMNARVLSCWYKTGGAGITFIIGTQSCTQLLRQVN